MDDPILPKRRSVRFAGYDYAQAGAYFVTICTADKRCVFGRVQNDAVQLHPYGRIAAERWMQIADHYPLVSLDEWIVMPNHVHGILVITSDANTAPPAQFGTTKSGSLSTVINRYKGAVTRSINAARLDNSLAPQTIWQARFYDRIIRSEVELNQIRHYIVENPQRWLLARSRD